MSWKKALGFGILIWVIMFAVVSAVLTYYNQYTWVKIAMVVLAGLIALILAGYAKPNSAVLAIGYGVVWVIVGLALDYFVTKKFNAEIFAGMYVWIGYALILLAPLLRVKKETV